MILIFDVRDKDEMIGHKSKNPFSKWTKKPGPVKKQFFLLTFFHVEAFTVVSRYAKSVLAKFFVNA